MGHGRFAEEEPMAIVGRFAVLGIALALSGTAWAGPNEEAAYRRALQNLVRTTFEAKGSLETASGRKIELLYRHAYSDGVRRTWIEVTGSGEFKGQRWLVWDRDGGADKIWHFDPKTKRVTEVPESQWTSSFLGSTFTLADFLFPDPDAYTFELGGEENVGGETFTVLRLAPKQKDKDRYAVRVYSVDPRAQRLVRGLFFDAQGRAVARWIVERTEQRGSEWFPSKQRVIELAAQKSTVLDLSDVRYEPELPAGTFEADGLAAAAKSPVPKDATPAAR
jgi:outer membrane lipoprotein-sorting protein